MPLGLVLIAIGLGALWMLSGAGGPPIGVIGQPDAGGGDGEAPDLVAVNSALRPSQTGIVALVLQLAGGQDPALVLGIIQQESAFDPGATRYEPALGESSLGLMQVLLSTARDRGFTGPPEGLLDPATNISVGVAQLDWIDGYLSRHGLGAGTRWTIAAYNEGVGNAMKGLPDLGYVQSVLAYAAEWRQYLDQTPVA